MSSAVNPNNRRRVRSRQMVGETPKAPGWRGASQATAATGSLYGRSNVYVAQPAETINMWGNISRTLGNVMLKLERNKTEEDADAKRLRLKQEALEEETQRLQGVRVANEINRTLIQGVIEGGITNPEEADAYAFEQLEQVAPVMGTAFYNSAYGKIVDGLNFVGSEFNKKLEAQYQTNARNIVSQSMNQVLLNTQNGTPEERRAAASQAIDVGVQSGLSLQQAQQDVWNSYLSTIRSLSMSGRQGEAVMLAAEAMESGIATSIPPDEAGRLGTEVLARTLWNVVDEHDQRETQMTQRDRQNRAYAQDANYGTFLVTAAAATTAPQLQSMRDQLSNMSTEDIMEQYGAQGSNLFKLLDNQEEYIITGRTPAGNAEAQSEIAERIRNSDYTLINDPMALNGYADRLTLQQMDAYRSQLAKIRGQQDPDEDTLVNSSLARLQGFFNPPPDTGGTPPPYAGLTLMSTTFSDTGKATASITQAGFAVRDILTEAVRKVNPADFQDNPLGLREARLKAVQEAEDAIRMGKDRRFVDIANTERATMGQEALTLAQRSYDLERDVRNNPEAQEALLKAVMPPRSSAEKVKRRIEGFADPKLQEFLKLQYASTQIVDRLVNAYRQEMAAMSMETDEDTLRQESYLLPMSEQIGMAQSRIARQRGQEPSLPQQAAAMLSEAQEMRKAALAWHDELAPQFAEFAPYIVDDPTAAAGILANSLPPVEE